MSDFLFKAGLSLIVIEKKIVAAEKLITLGGGCYNYSKLASQ